MNGDWSGGRQGFLGWTGMLCHGRGHLWLRSNGAGEQLGFERLRSCRSLRGERPLGVFFWRHGWLDGLRLNH